MDIIWQIRCPFKSNEMICLEKYIKLLCRDIPHVEHSKRNIILAPKFYFYRKSGMVKGEKLEGHGSPKLQW